jgi:hypothetical protein
MKRPWKEGERNTELEPFVFCHKCLLKGPSSNRLESGICVAYCEGFAVTWTLACSP